MTPKSIYELHRDNIGKISDKWESYLHFYDSALSPIRQAPINLLEIGIQNGGSLEVWANYFKSGLHFVGCDINPKCSTLKYNDHRISVVVGDINDRPSFQAISSISSEFDIIIDDGSHISDDILISFVNYFPLVKPGGIYIIEDTCTLYQDSFGGGILNEFSAYSFFKKVIDIINFKYWSEEISINTYLRTFFPKNALPAFILDGWINSVEFRNSLIAVRKSMTLGHEKLGPRLITGSSAQIETFGGLFRQDTL